ncbi:MAG: peptidase T [Anaerolineales bacterium]|jgi:tripeptide aminopeptidase
MENLFDSELQERLVQYARIDTTSGEESNSAPSTSRQFDLLNLLEQQLNEMGAQEVVLKEYGAVLATIPATASSDAPTIAFLAHVDTTESFNGSGVKPIVHYNYDGGEIHFPENPELVLSPAEQPYLAGKVGEDIITASGSTLLGADDKAGVAIVMTMAKHLLEHPDIPHGRIRIGFTTDEEIGRGVPQTLPSDLEAEFAYTLDGADLGEVVDETFSANKGIVTIKGVSIHPGEAKDKMVNALHLAAKIINTLPHMTLTPETTSGRQGYIHLYQLNGTAAEAEMHFILRDFDESLLKEHGKLLQDVCEIVQKTEPRARITCEIKHQYRNMRIWLQEDMRPVELAREACRQIGIEPFSKPIRGGTDGSRLTEMGVSTPNLFTGMQNYHGPLEYISVQDMRRSTEMCVKLVELWWAG